MASFSIKFLAPSLPNPTRFPKSATLKLNATPPQAQAAVAAPPPEVAAERLEPRVEEKDGYWILKEQFRQGINPQEKVKIEKEPTKLFMENDIEELAKIPIEDIDQPKLSKDDIDVRLKWLGLFHRRKNQCISIFNVKTQLGRNGRFMMRLNLPNGVTTSGQTRYLASVIRKYGEEGCADITTRQNWQIRGVVLPDVPEILKGVAEVVLTSLQSGMDNVRNVVGNPLARIDPEEMVDTRPYTNLLTQFITGNSHGNPAVSNLYSKRKYDTCWIQFLLTIRDSRPDPTKWKYTGFVVEITSKGNTPNFFQAAGTYCTSPSCNSAIIMPIFGLLVDEQQDQPV